MTSIRQYFRANESLAYFITSSQAVMSVFTDTYIYVYIGNGFKIFRSVMDVRIEKFTAQS